MKKLVLLLTALMLNVAFFTGCSGSDKKSSDILGGAPDSLTGKVMRGTDHWLSPTGWVDIARQERDYEFITDDTVRFTYVTFSDTPPYAPIKYYRNVTGNYTYRKTGANTAYLELRGDWFEEVYRHNLTINGDKITSTGTVTDSSETVQMKFEGRFTK